MARHFLLPYLDATILVACALAIAYLLVLVTDPAHVLLVFLAPIMGAAARAGFGPAILATGLGVLATRYFFATPTFSVAVADPKTVWALLVFVMVAAFAAYLGNKARTRSKTAHVAAAADEHQAPAPRTDEATRN